MYSQKYGTVSGRSARAARARRRRQRLKLAVIAGVFVGIAAILYYLLLPPVPPTQFASAQERDALATDLESRVKEFSHEVNRPQLRPAVLKVNQREINAYLQSSQKVQSELQARGVSDPSVYLANDVITATAEVPMGGVKVPVTVVGKLIPSNDKAMTFAVESIRVGKLGVPHTVTARMAAKIESMVSQGIVALPSRVSQIRVENGKLVIVGK